MNKLAYIMVMFVGIAAYAGDMITFNDNGAWCWYQDERVIVQNNKLIIGSVANGAGTGGSSRNGNIEVTTYDLGTGANSRFVLSPNLQADDHDLPAFLSLPDGKILAMYTRHISDKYIRYRITANPYDTTAWTPETLITRNANTSYSNIFQLSGENGRIYDFYRGENFNPNYVISDNNGQSWSYGGHLIRKDNHRPYVKYASNNVDKIHFITTEGHPRDYNNSVYHGYIYNGGIYKSDGTKLQDLADGPVAPESLTRIHAGSAMSVGWTAEIHLDESGNPVVGFTSQVDGVGLDIRYYYGRWDGSQWHINEMCYGGSRLYAGEDDYSGLMAIDPQDISTVYISVNVNPYTGTELISAADNKRHWEIFRGTTADMGASWNWKSITANSTVDNLRPIVPIWSGAYPILLWNRGTYSTYTNYDMDVVGMLDPEPINEGAPLIMQSPESKSVVRGGNVSFTVAADSDLPLHYSWYKVSGGAVLPLSVNNKTLVIENVEIADQGGYYCEVSNEAGSAVSATARLVIAELLGRWNLEGNYQDSSIYGLAAVVAGNPAFQTDKAVGEYSLSLDGNDYLNLGSTERFMLSDSGSVCAWVKANSLTNPWASIAGKGRSAWRLCRNNSTAAASFHINTASGELQANGTVAVADGQWHHVAGTWSGQHLCLYIDGVLNASVSASGTVNVNSDPVWIGGRSDSSSRFWNGLIDDVQIYSHALSVEELAGVMTGESGCSFYPLADFDRNCQVDLADLAMLAQVWLDCNVIPQANCLR